MTNLKDIRPTTLDGIKSLAKQIKRQENIKHADALHRAAKQAGYLNFWQARESLGSKES